MTRAKIEDLEAFTSEVSFLVQKGWTVEDAIVKVVPPYLLPPHGCHRDGDAIQIRDESGEAIYFTKNDQNELWVAATHRNGARIKQEQFLWLSKELSSWLDGGDVTEVAQS